MRWWWDYWKQNFMHSFSVWRRGVAVSRLIGLAIAAVVAFVPSLVILVVANSYAWGVGVGLGVWFAFLLFVIAPMRMWRAQGIELASLKTKRLQVSGFRTYVHRGTEEWLLLEVHNCSALPLGGCYAKLLRWTPIVDSRPFDESGFTGTALDRDLPPPGYQFHWVDFRRNSDLTATIAGRSHKELVIAVRQDQSDFVTVPSNDGSAFRFVGIGDFLLEIEVGSEVEAFEQTKVRFIFDAAGSNLAGRSVEEIA